jgi:hypothetical protein
LKTLKILGGWKKRKYWGADRIGRSKEERDRLMRREEAKGGKRKRATRLEGEQRGQEEEKKDLSPT